MIRKIILEDDAFMEEEIVDDFDVLREFQNVDSPRDYELHAPQPNAVDEILFTGGGLIGMEAFDETEPWPRRIRSR